MSKELAFGILSNLGTQSPILLTLLVGAGYGLYHRHRHPRLSAVVAVVSVLIAGALVVVFSLYSALPFVLHRYLAASSSSMTTIYGAISVSFTIFFAVGNALLIAAAFAGRKAT